MGTVNHKAILNAKNITVKNGFAFFWGSPFSQWYKSPFTMAGATFETAEHYMMYGKATIFGDAKIAKDILRTKDPKKVKALGKQVGGFLENTWNLHKYNVVYSGNIEKFKQNKELAYLLILSGDLELVEASPYDKIWGIGMGVDNPNITDKSKWQGENLLGKVLMDVRKYLIEHWDGGVSDYGFSKD
jgi:ribA/ribD-fused uncharacterized protein